MTAFEFKVKITTFRTEQLALADNPALVEALKTGVAIKAVLHYETWREILATLTPEVGMLDFVRPHVELFGARIVETLRVPIGEVELSLL